MPTELLKMVDGVLLANFKLLVAVAKLDLVAA
jgi:hypothetical protein